MEKDLNGLSNRSSAGAQACTWPAGMLRSEQMRGIFHARPTVGLAVCPAMCSLLRGPSSDGLGRGVHLDAGASRCGLSVDSTHLSTRCFPAAAAARAAGSSAGLSTSHCTTCTAPGDCARRERRRVQLEASVERQDAVSVMQSTLASAWVFIRVCSALHRSARLTSSVDFPGLERTPMRA